MALKIDTIAQSPDQAVLRVQGHLGGAAVQTLDSAIGRLLAQASRLHLDLRGVQLIDYDGLDMLVRRTRPENGRRSRVQLSLRDGKRFIRLQLLRRGIKAR